MPSKTRPNRATFAVLAAGVATYSLLQSLVLPVLPTIQHDLHTSRGAVTWVLTAYLLSASVFTPIVGRVGDIVGKERMFVMALAALGLGSLLGAVASSIELMIVGRVVQGIGGGVLPLAFGIIRDEFPEHRVAGAVGLIGSLTAVGGAFGLVLAGPIVSALDYRWLFWIPMFMCVVSAVAAHLVVPPSPRRPQQRIGWLAPVLLSGWLVALLVAVSKAPDWSWTSSRVLALLVLAAVLAVAWVAVELRSACPLIDMRMMRLPAVWTTNLFTLFLGAGMYAGFVLVAEFAQTPTSSGYGFGASVTEAGLLLLPLSVMMFATGSLVGRMTRRFGSKVTVVIGATIGIVPYAIFVFAHGHEWQIAIATALLGAGYGMSYGAMSNLIVAGVPAEQTGVASGMNANIRTIGGAIGAAVTATILTSATAANGLPTEAGYTLGFVVLGLAAALGVIVALRIPTLRRDPVTRLEPEAELPHPELAAVAGGTLSGADPE